MESGCGNWNQIFPQNSTFRLEMYVQQSHSQAYPLFQRVTRRKNCEFYAAKLKIILHVLRDCHLAKSFFGVRITTLNFLEFLFSTSLEIWLKTNASNSSSFHNKSFQQDTLFTFRIQLLWSQRKMKNFQHENHKPNFHKEVEMFDMIHPLHLIKRMFTPLQ